MTINNARLTDTEFELMLDRLEISPGRMVDPISGRSWARISGGQEQDGGSDGDGDDDGDEDDGSKNNDAREAKLRRSGERSGRKKLLRELGYGNAGDLKAALDALAPEGDGIVDDTSGGEVVNPPVAPKVTPHPVVPAPADNASTVAAELKATVAVELATAGVDPKKVKRATTIVLNDLDPGDNPSEDDVADVIDTLRDEEPDWFNDGSSDDSDLRPRSGVPDPGRPGSKPMPDATTRGSQIYEDRKGKGAQGFKLPITTQ